MNPHNHPCNQRTIDYSNPQQFACICGRTWTLGARGWWVEPKTTHKP